MTFKSVLNKCIYNIYILKKKKKKASSRLSLERKKKLDLSKNYTYIKGFMCSSINLLYLSF